MPSPIKIRLNDAFTSSANLSGDSRRTRIVVGGQASGFATAGAATEDSIMAVLLGELQVQKGIVVSEQPSAHPVFPNLLVSDLVVRGLSHNSVAFQIIYQYPTGFAPTILQYRIRTVERMVETDKSAFDLKPVFVGWKGRASENGNDPIDPAIPKNTVYMRRLKTVTTVTATISQQGFLDEATTTTQSGVVGLVNNAPWLGRPAGCWKMSEYEGDESAIDGYYSVRASAYTFAGLTAPFEDFRTLEMLFNPKTGFYCKPDTSKLEATLEAAYKFGPINTGNGGTNYDPNTDGFYCEGPYPMVSFPSLWSNLIHL